MFRCSPLLLVSRHKVRCQGVCTKAPPKLPEEPTTCCMRGCANCVWIEYAEEVQSILDGSDNEKIAQMVLDKIKDPNLRTFLTMELKSKGFK